MAENSIYFGSVGWILQALFSKIEDKMLKKRDKRLEI